MVALVRATKAVGARTSNIGEMAERFKAPVLKTGEGSNLPWVRIPLSPPQRWRNFLILKKNPGFGFLASVFFSVFRMRLKGGSGTLTQRRPWQEMLI